MSEKRKVLRAAGIVGAFTLLSRFTGLFRDMVLAALFGASRMADTFNTAFEVVNQVRRVLGEGALSSFIVPIFTERRQTSENEGWRFFNRTLNLLALISILITLAGMWYSREVFMAFGGVALNKLVAQGDLPAGEAARILALGSSMTRLMFPYVIGITLVALFMGACHSLRSFTAPSLGSVILNLAMILAGALAMLVRTSDERAAYWLCWSVLLGALLRVVMMFPPLWRHGWRWEPLFSIRDPELRKLLAMMGLGLLGMFLSQINVAVSGFFAWYLGEGVKTNITYANRLIQLPMALTATAVATALLPQLTQFLLEERYTQLRDMMGFIKRLEIVFILPAIAGLILLGYPITQVIFERRAFTPEDTWGTYLALVAYAPGLLAMGGNRLLQPLYYARKDMLTPLLAGGVSVAVNVVLNWLFAFHTSWAQVGLGISNSIASFAGYGVLAGLMHSTLKQDPGESPRVGETLWKSGVASLVACGLGAGLYVGWVHMRGVPVGTMNRLTLLAPVLLLVSFLYIGLIRLLRVPDSERAIKIIRDRIKR